MGRDTTMTPRRRWLAAAAGEPVDRLPFWPKLGDFWLRAQPEPVRSMALDAAHRWIGSDPHAGVGTGVREVRRRTSVERHRDGPVRQTVWRTPHGTLDGEERFTEESQAWHPVRFPVRSPADLPAMRAAWEDLDFEPDPEGAAAARRRVAEIGESASSHAGIGESGLMHWVEHIAGIENGQYWLADEPGEVGALLDAIDAANLRKARQMVEHCPADFLYMTENTSTTLVSPAQYARHCAPPLRRIGEVCRDRGRALVLHMCGHLRDLLGQLASMPAVAFEAFTSPPVGNVRLAEGRAACPDKCLVGGTNAWLWTRPVDEILSELRRDLDAMPHHRRLVVTSGGMQPPATSPETLRAVCEFVHAYPARMD